MFIYLNIHVYLYAYVYMYVSQDQILKDYKKKKKNVDSQPVAMNSCVRECVSTPPCVYVCRHGNQNNAEEFLIFFR